MLVESVRVKGVMVLEVLMVVSVTLLVWLARLPEVCTVWSTLRGNRMSTFRLANVTFVSTMIVSGMSYITTKFRSAMMSELVSIWLAERCLISCVFMR